MRIAMWSGPRNLSTAMMYAFGARSDFAVWDEPYYAAYLAQSGQDHPLRAKILASGEHDPEQIADHCLGSIPGEKPHFYMKHMAHHMLGGFPLDWANDCMNIHLIRHPARVIASYAAKRQEVGLDDIGYRQQAEVYRRVGGLVLDSADVRNNPEKSLRKLCETIGLSFDPTMLAWPKGGHVSDGAWAAHWYKAVHESTGFAGPEGPLPELSGTAAELAAKALPYYEFMQEKL